MNAPLPPDKLNEIKDALFHGRKIEEVLLAADEDVDEDVRGPRALGRVCGA